VVIDMRRERTIWLCVLLFGVGTAAGTVLANRLFASGLVDYRLLYETCVRTAGDSGFGGSSARLILIRILETAAVTFTCSGNRGRTGAGTLLVLAGCFVSAKLSLMTWCRGILGPLAFAVGCFPDGPLYAAAWGLLILRAVAGREVRRERFWLMFALLTAAAVLLEIYVSPAFLRLL